TRGVIALRRRCAPLYALMAACAGALAVGSPARADDATGRPVPTDGGTPVASELQGAPVEIVGVRPSGGERAPASQTTVIEVARFAGGVRSVAELLKTAPGVSVRSLGGPGQ